MGGGIDVIEGDSGVDVSSPKRCDQQAIQRGCAHIFIIVKNNNKDLTKILAFLSRESKLSRLAHDTRSIGMFMSSLRYVIAGVVLVSFQAGPALAQCGPSGCPAGVPGPEIGIGVLGLLIAGGAVRYLRQRAKR